MSASSDDEDIKDSMLHGACSYLVKPLKLGDIQMLWKWKFSQKKRRIDPEPASYEDRLNSKEETSNDNGDQISNMPSGDMNDEKKPRLVWTSELHNKFVTAVDQIGYHAATPKKIVKVMREMNEPDITRENVASHLQKYREHFVKKRDKVSKEAEQSVTQANATALQSVVELNTNAQACSSSRNVQNMGGYKLVMQDNVTPLHTPSVVGLSTNIQALNSFIDVQYMGDYKPEMQAVVTDPLQTVPFVADLSTNIQANNLFTNYHPGSTSRPSMQHNAFPFFPRHVEPEPYPASISRLAEIGFSPTMISNSGENILGNCFDVVQWPSVASPVSGSRIGENSLFKSTEPSSGGELYKPIPRRNSLGILGLSRTNSAEFSFGKMSMEQLKLVEAKYPQTFPLSRSNSSYDYMFARLPATGDIHYDLKDIDIMDFVLDDAEI